VIGSATPADGSRWQPSSINTYGGALFWAADDGAGAGEAHLKLPSLGPPVPALRRIGLVPRRCDKILRATVNAASRGTLYLRSIT
jgi:hypothetical protein